MDLVTKLIAKPFSSRSLAEKKIVLQSGRPTPRITAKKSGRNFQTSWYNEIEWLCGSTSTNNLYCWPCLLFQPKTGQSWTDSGYSNYRNLKGDSPTHGSSKNHLANYKKMKKIWKARHSTSRQGRSQGGLGGSGPPWVLKLN